MPNRNKLKEHCIRELELIGYSKDNQYHKDIIEIIDVYIGQKHSDLVTPNLFKMLSRLVEQKPLSDLTGDQSEWDPKTNQNKRYQYIYLQSNNAYDTIKSKKIEFPYKVK